MINTSESTATGRRGSFALKLGALVAASSLMLAGGVAVATSVYAAPNDNANSQGKKPDKDGGNNAQNNGNENAPGQNDNNGGAVGGDNGKDNPAGNNGNNSDDGSGGQGTVSVEICHATRSYDNPYVYIVVDASSVDELIQELSGKGNGHGDHVGAVFDPETNRSGNNWGDIIGRVVGQDGVVYSAGYNLTPAGEAILGAKCQTPKPTTYTASLSFCASLNGGDYVKDTGPFVGESTESQALANKAAEDAAALQGYTIDKTGAACGSTVVVCDPSVEQCDFTANDGAAFCEVTGGSYNGVGSYQVYSVPGSSQAAAQAAADADVQAALNARAKGDNIVPPHKNFPGYNWNEKTQARFEAGCSPNQSVLAVNAGLAGTTPTKKPASGNPQPGKVTVPAAGAPLPGSVPAGDGSSIPGLPVWALALLAVGAIGAAASGMSLMTSRKG